MERSEVILIAAIVLFVFAFIASGVLPIQALSAMDKQYMDWDALAAPERVPEPFKELAIEYPEAFLKHFGGHFPEDLKGKLTSSPWRPVRRKTLRELSEADQTRLATAYSKAYREALQLGRDAYISESCWHCHSQYIRPVAKEEQRWGAVSEAEEYNNAASMPPLWGTRRVGPDLSRQHGVHTNDWHMAHLWQPTSTSPGSVMPRYPWFFETKPAEQLKREQELWASRKEAKGHDYAVTEWTPGKRALAVVAYLQFLGTTRDQVGDDDAPWRVTKRDPAEAAKTGPKGEDE